MKTLELELHSSRRLREIFDRFRDTHPEGLDPLSIIHELYKLHMCSNSILESMRYDLSILLEYLSDKHDRKITNYHLDYDRIDNFPTGYLDFICEDGEDEEFILSTNIDFNDPTITKLKSS